MHFTVMSMLAGRTSGSGTDLNSALQPHFGVRLPCNEMAVGEQGKIPTPLQDLQAKLFKNPPTPEWTWSRYIFQKSKLWQKFRTIYIYNHIIYIYMSELLIGSLFNCANALLTPASKGLRVVSPPKQPWD